MDQIPRSQAELSSGDARKFVVPVHFTTKNLPKSEQFEAWRDTCEVVADISPLQCPSDGFEVEHQFWDVGNLLLSRTSAPSVSFVREARRLKKYSVDHWILSYSMSGFTKTRLADDVCVAPPGVPFLRSLGEPFDGTRTDASWLTLFMPRDAFQRISGSLDATRNTILNTALGGLLGDYMLALERRLSTVKKAELPALVEATRAMIAACIGPSPERLADAHHQISPICLERARQAVRRNLRSPALGPERLCGLLGVSRSRLFRLFEHAGGVTHYIQHQRFLEAHRALSDADDRRPISEIAADLGLTDASGFSRTFRRKFGCSPSDIRAAALSGLAVAPDRTSSSTNEQKEFGDLLLRLQS